jgi:hypothetical protein
VSNQAQPLLIDRAATARRLSEDEVRRWAEDQRVFISSVINGYREPRAAAAGAVEAVGAEAVMFERFGGRDSDPEQAYLAEVASSSIYVGLLGARYGRPLPSRYSATHAECRHAEERGLRLSVWVESGVDREGPQQSFIEEIQTFNVTGQFDRPEDLQRELEARLRAIAAEDLSPWCKLGVCLFRAKEIRISSGTAVIEATVKDDEVADAIAGLESDFGRRNTTFAYWDGVYDAEVKGISAVNRAGGSRDLTIELGISAPPSPTTYSMNGMEYDELTELAIKVSWMGEDNPLGMMGFQAEIENPFARLRELAPPPEEALRPIAFVLAFEILARDRNVARLSRFRLGPAVAGERNLALAWTPRVQYANQPRPAPREVEGRVPV